jgi:HAD superfamily hydrolase (TIGR01509 family)
LRRRAGRQRGDILPRACRDADAPRLFDHGRSGAAALPRRLRPRSAPDHRGRFRGAQVKTATLQFYTGDLKAIANVAEAIAGVALPKCVASSGTPEKLRHGLDCAGRYDVLAPHIFSATQVKRGKPAPDLFLFAAAQMRAAPGRCLVIEDSIPGVTGARAAGMTVLGFHGGSHCQVGHAEMLLDAGATATFDDMRQLPDLVRQIMQKTVKVAGFSAP